ncbi:MAG: DUF177 domain-containing protein [Armatimonadetes bacterium]|nr:DUF177 domain-containing protein [Armatimonadota bacterium]
MIIDASSLKRRNTGTVSASFKTKADLSGISLDGEVEGQVECSIAGQGLLVRGAVQSSVRLECCRCLEEFTSPLEAAVVEEFLPAALVGTDPERFTFGDDYLIDLTEVVRQSLILGLPMRPLCTQDCKGLCQVCGRNLNEGACNCSVPTAESMPETANMER